MRRHPFLGVAVLTVVLAACGGPAAVEVGSPSSPSDGESPTAGTNVVALRCEDVSELAAPDEWYREAPIYVGNEMPIDELTAWARERAGFEASWIDREHNGWISLAFSTGAEEQQAALEAEFPDVGVVAVPVDWTSDELDALRPRVDDWARANVDGGFGHSARETTGHVHVDVPFLTDDLLTSFAAAFHGDRACIAGADPATAPEPGPQPTSGDGWRLLADELTFGEQVLATDESQYASLWSSLGLTGDRPPVDFDAEVVVHLAAVYSGSCPDIRLDDVVTGAANVEPVITQLSTTVVCTADANPRAFVVALNRATLPAGGFTIEVGVSEPTRVTTDLTVPGAVTGPAELRPGPPEQPEPSVSTSGAYVETGVVFGYRFSVHCGIGTLGIVNDQWWYADGLDGRDPDPFVAVPDAWRGDLDEAAETIVVDAVLEPGDPPTLTAVLNDHEVVYTPGPEPDYGCM